MLWWVLPVVSRYVYIMWYLNCVKYLYHLKYLQFPYGNILSSCLKYMVYSWYSPVNITPKYLIFIIMITQKSTFLYTVFSQLHSLQALKTTNILSIPTRLTVVDSTYAWEQVVTVFLCLTCFTSVMITTSVHRMTLCNFGDYFPVLRRMSSAFWQGLPLICISIWIIWIFKTYMSGASEMIWWVKILATNLDLGLIQEIHMVEGENRLS